MAIAIATVSLSPNTSLVNNAIMIDEDAESDASSDLFEIESFTTTITTTAVQSLYPATMYRRRDSMDNASSNNGFFICRRSMDERSTATECYELSEASIEWSVTTVAAEEESSIGKAEVQGRGGGERWKRKGLLVSCRSEKAVSVGPQPVVRSVEGQRGASRHLGVNSGFKIGGVVSVNKPCQCYQLSEASIEWSVTTVAAEEESSIGKAEVQGRGGGERWKRKGLLVSCRSEKAVSVGPQPVVRSVEGQRGASRHLGVNSGFKIGGVVSVNKPPLPRSNINTPPLSLAFAT